MILFAQEGTPIHTKAISPNCQRVFLEDLKEHYTCTQEYVLSHSGAGNKGILRVAVAAVRHVSSSLCFVLLTRIVYYPQQLTQTIQNFFLGSPDHDWLVLIL